MSLNERLSELIKRIYCAGLDSRDWDGVAVDLLDLTGAHAALTSIIDLTHRNFTS